MRTFKCLKGIALSSVVAAMAMVAVSGQSSAETSPFNKLLGTWGGSGIFELKSGSKERITCKGYYTGGGSQLGMNIHCTSGSGNKIEMRSKISQAGGKITGKWEERTFNAEGNLSGKAHKKRMNLSIKGAISGSMNVTFSRVRQQVDISTVGTDLKSVKITLTRR